MENPVKEIPGVIHLLTQSSPSKQRETIETYFTPNASFTHPFCRTGSWENSRFLIKAIYRWYKIMSPTIELKIHSVAYDASTLHLYVSISQVFRIWIVPFYKAPVALVTVLQLNRNKTDGKYYIESQNDLYQVDQFVRFVWPGGWILVWIWQFMAMLFCLAGALVFWPISVVEEWAIKREERLMQGYGSHDEKKGLVDEAVKLLDGEMEAVING
ncbi:hypothetical protein K432DRAFT_382570 [Lepidopterella palustris CBS 459.81]|uniref:SigF-like NTF2-like domain-containing protein n=1 Tax=Lepidopterella palustris CBS 459.81 TaxID=1314670 RepID=A0A8E2E9W3_9PEZI|nr:hypothetical protein K432DRAFT_382570 [Lepidopterella palustris CBS 459.81]